MKYLPLCLVVACLELSVKSQAANPTLTIASGVVIGTATGVFSAPSSTTTVHNYLGIPFAAVPTGTARFAPPAAPTAWSSPLYATSFPPSCIQQFPPSSEFLQKLFNNPGSAPLPESEDCLYLNVFAPMDASISNQKAVLFWIYGGNLVSGSGSFLIYNGSSFAGFQDVIVVTFNYRLNIFGFSGSPEIPFGQQNSGYLDQRFALQWVQDNIAHFGGDPTKVTIFGESAGGYSVKQLLAQPPSPLPFRAAIMESPAAGLPGTALASYEQTLDGFGCTVAESPIQCLRSNSATDLKTYIMENNISFPPLVDHITQTNDARPNILSRQFSKVPFIIGSNANEGRVFASIAGLDMGTMTAEQFVSSIIPNIPLVQQAVLAVYRSLSENVFLLASTIITDFVYTCPLSLFSSFAAQNGFDVWRYYYNASFPDLHSFPWAGAYHSSEITQVFGTYPLANQYGVATKQQEQLSRYMQSTWADFAKNPEQGPGWPRLGTNFGLELAQLGGGNSVGETTMDLGQVDNVCGAYDIILDLQGY